MNFASRLLSLLVGLAAADVTVYDDLRYDGDSAVADASCQKECPSCPCLSLYVDKTVSKPSSLLLFMHGGLWYSGSRKEIDAVCRAVVLQSAGAMACATADYSYSQDLGGCCDSSDCHQTYRRQAEQVVAARDYLARVWSNSIDASRLVIGGHSAGGHMSAVLAVQWANFSNAVPPLAFVSVEGIHDVPLWQTYDQTRWRKQFACKTKQAFGTTEAEAQDGSPTLWLKAGFGPPVAPMLIVHSPGDDYVQAKQASGLFEALDSQSGHRLDVDGHCVSGEHNQVLAGSSASALAKCMLDFSNDHQPAAHVLSV